MLRGISGRCPRCGRGAIFAGFLDIAAACHWCRLRFSDHDIGDGPAVAGIFIIGTVALVAAVMLEFAYQPPLWVHALVSAPLVLGGSIAVLRPLKGVTLALQYRYRAVDKPTPPGGG